MKKYNVSLNPCLNQYPIVYFRIFDTNRDKKIDRSDLNKVMRMLFGSKLTNTDMQTLGDKIFTEVI